MSVWHCYITGKSSSEDSGWGEDHVDVDVPKGAVIPRNMSTTLSCHVANYQNNNCSIYRSVIFVLIIRQAMAIIFILNTYNYCPT